MYKPTTLILTLAIQVDLNLTLRCMLVDNHYQYTPYQNLMLWVNLDQTLIYSLFVYSDPVTKVAEILKFSDGGFRLVVNNGPDSGEEVPHFHVHLIGGTRLGGIA